MTEVVETITRYKAFDGRLFAKKEACERHEYLVNKFKSAVGCEEVHQVFDTDEKIDCVWIETEQDLKEYHEYVKHAICHSAILNTSYVLHDKLPTFVLCYYNPLDDEFYVGTISQYYRLLEDIEEEVEGVIRDVKHKYHLCLHQ